MRVLLATVLLAVCSAGSALAESAVPCRNMKSAAQCAVEEADVVRARKPVTPESNQVRIHDGVAAMERITVTPDSADLPSPTKEKWEAFAGRIAAKRGFQEMPGNGGGWLVCVTEPPVCKVNCCTRYREFSITGRNVGGLGAY